MRWRGWSVFAILLVADCLLKWYVVASLPLSSATPPFFPFGGISFLHNWYGIDLALVHVANKGAAWGLFSSWTEYLLALRMIIVIGLIFYLIAAEEKGGMWIRKLLSFVTQRSIQRISSIRRLSLSLICVGALGNILDSFLYGHVIDMFYISFWNHSYPVFNLADSAICIGTILLITERLFDKKSELAS